MAANLSDTWHIAKQITNKCTQLHVGTQRQEQNRDRSGGSKKYYNISTHGMAGLGSTHGALPKASCLACSTPKVTTKLVWQIVPAVTHTPVKEMVLMWHKAGACVAGVCCTLQL